MFLFHTCVVCLIFVRGSISADGNDQQKESLNGLPQGNLPKGVEAVKFSTKLGDIYGRRERFTHGSIDSTTTVFLGLYEM